MKRPASTRTIAALATLLLGGLPFAVIGVVRAVPAVPLEETSLAWVTPALLAVLAIVGAAAAVASIVRALRGGSVAPLLELGGSATLAGAALTALALEPALTVPVVVAATFSIGSALAAGGGWQLRSRQLVLFAAAGVLLTAEAAAFAELPPGLADAVDGARSPILVAAILAATAAGVAQSLHAGGRSILLAVGATGLLADRGGSLEAVIALAALVGNQLLVLRDAVTASAGRDDAAETTLPELAARLSDAVLRFDGALRLRDWNAAAASLLGVDAASPGTRIEDLLGIGVGDLPATDAATTTRRVLGGLEIALHRSGLGVTAVIRDPGATPDAERLGEELRSTIEELLRARRTIDLQRGELERSSTIDPLTGVSSRGAILERLRLEVAQARRYRHPLAVVLLDVDGFGEINRQHGIGGGDAVLRETALRIRLRVREADALGRCGSDGFLAILPHTDEAGAATFSDALRHRLGLRPVAVGDDLVRVTASVGVATMRPGEDLDLDGLLARVQEALDSARSAGGDTIALDRLHGLARLEDRREPPRRPVADDEVAGGD